MKKIAMTNEIEARLHVIFLFDCPECGEYRVSETTARNFITARLNRALDKELHKGAHGASFRFRNGCPRCCPDNLVARIEVAALWPRLN